MVEYNNMDKRIKNLIGQKFNRLTVINYFAPKAKIGHAYWVCICDCGKEKIVRASHLKTGSVKSCGCYASEVFSKKLKEYATSERHKGKGNPMWKGRKTKYASIHTWLSKNYTKEKCEKCGAIKNLQWALKKGRIHNHTRNNYFVLCSSCHLKYDYTDERRKKMGIMLNSTKKNKKKL